MRRGRDSREVLLEAFKRRATAILEAKREAEGAKAVEAVRAWGGERLALQIAELEETTEELKRCEAEYMRLRKLRREESEKLSALLQQGVRETKAEYLVEVSTSTGSVELEAVQPPLRRCEEWRVIDKAAQDMELRLVLQGGSPGMAMILEAGVEKFALSLK